jgi:hypothetical protein
MGDDRLSPWSHYASATGGVEPSRSAAARRVIETYSHYLSTRPESYGR